jgi:hypothetical protein
MKKLLMVIFAVLVLGTGMNAQQQSLQFIYITKDFTTRVNPLVEELRDIYDFARVEQSSAVVFYLPNMDNPIVVKVNLPGDNRQDMDKIFEALMTSSETAIDPSMEQNFFYDIFDEIPLTDVAGNHRFSEVELKWYITPSFWDLGFNEEVIATLWFTMDFDMPWARDYVSMSIFHQDSDGIEVDYDHPFGLKNLCRDYLFQLLTY